MSRIIDTVIVGVSWAITAIYHLMAVEIFDPSGALFGIAAEGATLNGQQRAVLWHEILVVWVPLIAVAGVMAWAFVREYRRQRVTAVRAP